MCTQCTQLLQNTQQTNKQTTILIARFACCSSPPHVLPIKLLLLLWSPGICFPTCYQRQELFTCCVHTIHATHATNKQTQQTMSTTCSARCSSPPQSSCLASLTSTFSVAPRFRFCIPSFVLVSTDRNSLCYDVLLQVRRQQSSAMSLIFTQPNSSLCRNGCS